MSPAILMTVLGGIRSVQHRRFECQCKWIWNGRDIRIRCAFCTTNKGKGHTKNTNLLAMQIRANEHTNRMFDLAWNRRWQNWSRNWHSSKRKRVFVQKEKWRKQQRQTFSHGRQIIERSEFRALMMRSPDWDCIEFLEFLRRPSAKRVDPRCQQWRCWNWRDALRITEEWHMTIVTYLSRWGSDIRHVFTFVAIGFFLTSFVNARAVLSVAH